MIINKPSHYLYYIINIVAIIIGITYVILSFKKEKTSNKKVILFMILFLLSALFCGKLYTVILSKGKINFLNAGLASYGGLIGAILFTIIFEKFTDLKGIFIKYTILSLPLIYSLSKFSCFIFGCCHGIVYNGLFSMKYPSISNESYFPIQLLEIITFMIIFQYCNINKNKSSIIYITLILISIFKFSLDFLRYEHIGKILTSNQIFSIILFSITLILLIINNKRKLLNKSS